MLVSARRDSVLVALGTLVIASSSVFGCTSVPTFPAPERDGGQQCSDTEPCPSGQSCLQGICYTACDATHGCSAREMCVAGVCVTRTTDAGTVDVGMDGGPCALLTCTAPTALCRADVAQCVACDFADHDSCGGGTAVCDVGRGECTAFTPSICAACNSDADCATGMTCRTRGAPDPAERVCLPDCDASGACPSSDFVCNGSSVCVPFASSCTAYRAAVTHRSCTTDADCPQLGATVDDGLITGMCFDDGAGGGPFCHVNCGLPSDCPPGFGTCALSPAGGTLSFCQ